MPWKCYENAMKMLGIFGGILNAFLHYFEAAGRTWAHWVVSGHICRFLAASGVILMKFDLALNIWSYLSFFSTIGNERSARASEASKARAAIRGDNSEATRNDMRYQVTAGLL